MREWSTLKKLIWLFAAVIKGGASWAWSVVTGNAPLSLSEAVAHEISRITQYGLCTQSTTLTPSAPVDIMCNNGALRMVDDELPVGYKRVLGFSMKNNAYWEIPNFPMNGSDTLRFSFEVSDACNVIGAYSGSASGNNYSLYVSASSSYLRYKNGAYNSTVDFDTRYDVEITPTGSSGMKVDSTWTAQTFTTPTNFCIGTTSVTASSAKLKGKLYGNIEVVGRAKFIPCERVSDNALGYYDTIGSAFYEQASGFDGAVSLGYDGSHYQLSVVGTPEVLTVRGVNLCNPALYTGGGWYISANNTVSSAASNGTLVFPCKPNTTYSWWHTSGAGGARAFELTTDEVTAGQSATWAVGNPAYNDAMTVREYTTSANAKLLCVLFARVADQVGRTIDEQLADFMLVEGDIEEAFAYQPYHEPQTVTNLPMLLSVGDYKDEVELISGIKTGKVGIKVLTSADVRSFSNGCFFVDVPEKKKEKSLCLCTHFVYDSGSSSGISDGQFGCASTTRNFYFKNSNLSDIDEVKTFVDDQYAAGTPVIVLYPLEEETTEQTTAHSLHTTQGENVVSVTANVSPISLEVEYAKQAS